MGIFDKLLSLRVKVVTHGHHIYYLRSYKYLPMTRSNKFHKNVPESYSRTKIIIIKKKTAENGV